MNAGKIPALALAAAVASLGLVAPLQAEIVAITGATVHTLGERGTIDNCRVLIADGLVTAVGRDIDIPAGARIIDATGKVVTPGLFDPYSYIGLSEVSLDDGSNDSEQNGTRYTAAFDVADAINPQSTLIDVNRIEGVTRALVVPAPGETGSVISGLGAVIDLGGSGNSLTQRGAAMIMHLDDNGSMLAGGSRALTMSTLRDALEDAQDYRDHEMAWADGDRHSYSLGRLDLEALQPVIKGTTPVIINAHRASDIRAALTLANEFGLKLVIAGGAESWLVADELAAADVPVILDPLANLPRSFEMVGARSDTATLLYRAGVMVAFSIGDSHNARNLSQSAGNAVAEGLPWDEGLAAVTRNPARILGLEKQLGTLETGQVADVVVWSGDPLEVTSFADHVFIAGVAVPMVSRQTLLRDRYLGPENKWPRAYRSPGQ